MTNQVRIYRVPFTTMADGSEAALTLHEVVGSGGDGPTVGISAAVQIVVAALAEEPVGARTPVVILKVPESISFLRSASCLLTIPIPFAPSSAHSQAHSQIGRTGPHTMDALGRRGIVSSLGSVQ